MLGISPSAQRIGSESRARSRIRLRCSLHSRIIIAARRSAGSPPIPPSPITTSRPCSSRVRLAICASNYKKKMHRISLSVLRLHRARIDQSHLISLDSTRRATTCGYLVSIHIIVRTGVRVCVACLRVRVCVCVFILPSARVRHLHVLCKYPGTLPVCKLVYGEAKK